MDVADPVWNTSCTKSTFTLKVKWRVRSPEPISQESTDEGISSANSSSDELYIPPWRRRNKPSPPVRSKKPSPPGQQETQTQKDLPKPSTTETQTEPLTSPTPVAKLDTDTQTVLLKPTSKAAGVQANFKPPITPKTCSITQTDSPKPSTIETQTEPLTLPEPAVKLDIDTQTELPKPLADSAELQEDIQPSVTSPSSKKTGRKRKKKKKLNVNLPPSLNSPSVQELEDDVSTVDSGCQTRCISLGRSKDNVRISLSDWYAYADDKDFTTGMMVERLHDVIVGACKLCSPDDYSIPRTCIVSHLFICPALKLRDSIVDKHCNKLYDPDLMCKYARVYSTLVSSFNLDASPDLRDLMEASKLPLELMEEIAEQLQGELVSAAFLQLGMVDYLDYELAIDNACRLLNLDMTELIEI